MKKIVAVIAAHRNFWTSENRISLYLGILLLVASLLIQINANQYATVKATNYVGDAILDRIPTIDLDFIIVHGSMLAWLFTGLLLLAKPRRLLFAVKTIALFVLVRAFFISLTHIGVRPDRLIFGFDGDSFLYAFYTLFTFEGDFFFSGHTGFPFLIALLFWNEPFWRKFFLAVTLVFGVSVLFAHVHYSIDVFAAPFITYAIFAMAKYIFKKDHRLMTQPARTERFFRTQRLTPTP